MQFTFTLVAALSYVFLSALSGIEGAPVGKVLDATTVKALVPEAVSPIPLLYGSIQS